MSSLKKMALMSAFVLSACNSAMNRSYHVECQQKKSGETAYNGTVRGINLTTEEAKIAAASVSDADPATCKAKRLLP